MQWTFDIYIRSKNAAGAVQKTWTPRTLTDGAPVGLIPEIWWEKVVLERVLTNGGSRPYTRGFYLHLDLTLAVQEGHIPAASGSSALEEVLEDTYQDGYLEISLDGTSTYERVTWENDLEFGMPGGFQNAVEVTLEFKWADLKTAITKLDAFNP